jgi:hypothetical protein
MPRLLIFAACEKVDLDAEDLASLSRIMERIEVPFPNEAPLPRSVPMKWETISVWIFDSGETGLYEQKEEMVTTDGTVFMRVDPRVLQSTKTGAPGVKIVSTMTAIPAINGRLELRLSYRKIGDPKWILAATYPVEVTLVRQ